jgi:NTP pyrophosphatase (non-canonical NTP hydrolase)
MELLEYKIEAPKPRKNMGTVDKDLQHMIIGIFSEFNELEDALAAREEVNILEELGDCSWYVVNHADVRKFHLLKVDTEETYGYKDFVYTTSKLANLVKRSTIYNKETDLLAEQILTQKAFTILCNFRRVDGNGIYDINDIMRRNINKLTKGKNARYKDGVYTDQAAQVRDEAAERKELEK